jgi:hypothetical protein
LSNSNNLLNNKIKNNTSITSTDSIIKPSCESKDNPKMNINKSTNLAAATITNSIDGVALDSACTDSSYRISDANNQNVQIIPVNANETLNVTAANGESIRSYAKGILKYNDNIDYDQNINIFQDNQLTIGMHAVNTFTNHPAKHTCLSILFLTLRLPSQGEMEPQLKRVHTTMMSIHLRVKALLRSHE